MTERDAGCRSPIEWQFLNEFVERGYKSVSQPTTPEDAWFPYKTRSRWDHREERFILLVGPTIITEGLLYDVDFALVHHWGRRPGCTTVGIELDGHDFHEKSKEQVARDKSRDRALARAGWEVLRFSGAEIHADTPGCVNEAMVTADAIDSRGSLAWDKAMVFGVQSEAE